MCFQNLVHIQNSSDQPNTYVTRSEAEDYEVFIEDNLNQFMIEPPTDEDDTYSDFLGEVKTARIIQDWISEATEKDITDNYNVGMGDVHRFVQSAEWLIYSASEIARITNSTGHLSSLHTLRSRIKYGVRGDILELVNLRGVGRIRGRMLRNHGLSDLSSLYNIPLEELARIPTIGTAVAESIKRQLGLDVKSTASPINSETEDDDIGQMQTLLDDFT